MAYVWLLAHDVACIAATVYLVSIDQHWWAVFFAVMLATTMVKKNESGGG